MKKFLVTVFILSCFLKPGFSQDVDPLSGRAIVSLPIGSISAYDLSVGVSLSHSGGALRLNKGPGNAGMGWNVNIGVSPAMAHSYYGFIPDDLA